MRIITLLNKCYYFKSFVYKKDQIMTVEAIPWSNGKSHLTKAYQIFLAKWARKLSWKETAEAFQTSWENVFNSVAFVVIYGLLNRNFTRKWDFSPT